MGFLHSSIWATVSVSTSFTSPLNTFSAAVRSTPEQNARPDPVKMMTRTDSSLPKALIWRAKRTIIGLVKEFSDLGRFIVIVAMPFRSRVTRMRFSIRVWSIFKSEKWTLLVFRWLDWSEWRFCWGFVVYWFACKKA